MKRKNVEPKTITLYHFTSFTHLGLILNAGELSRGDVPKTSTTGYNAVWFNNSPSIDCQMGMLMNPTADKTQIRITVELPFPFPKLYKWDKIASKIGVDKQMYRGLDEISNHGSHHWWLFAGSIPVEIFKSIELRESKNNPYQVIDLEESTEGLEFLKNHVRGIEQVMATPVTVLPFPEL